MADMSSTPIDAEQSRKAPEDFDLVDLWIIFRKHALAFWTSFLLVAAAGIALTLLSVPQYRYATILQIGGRQTTNQFLPVIPLDTASAWIQKSIIPEAIKRLQKTEPHTSLQAFDIQVARLRPGNGIVLSVNGPAAQSKIIRQLLTEVGHLVAQDTNRRLISTFDAVRKLTLAQVASIEARLHALNIKQRRLSTEQRRLGTMRYSGHSTLMLMFSTMQVASLQKELYMQVASLEKQLYKMRRELVFSLPLEMRVTRPLAPPLRSLQPVGLTPLKKVALILLFAIFAGVSMVIFLHLRGLAKARLMAQREVV